MRYLMMVRHAKAERESPTGVDVDRRLSARGRRQCEQLRAWALDSEALGRYGPATALVSSAARTTETFRRAFADTALVGECHVSDLMYNGHRDVTAEDLLIDLAAIDPVTTSLLVVGHNPTVHDLLVTLVDDLPDAGRESFPTGAVYVVALRDDQPVALAHYELLDHFVPD